MKKKEIEVDQVRALAAEGLNDSQIAYKLGLHPVSFGRRKGQDPALRDALEKGREGLERPDRDNCPVDPEKRLPADIRFEIDDDALALRIDDKIARIFHYLDDEKLAKANATTLSTSLGILIDKRRLLKGQPTEILSFEELKELNELVPQLVAEARRRGLALDVEPIKEITDNSNSNDD